MAVPPYHDRGDLSLVQCVSSTRRGDGVCHPISARARASHEQVRGGQRALQQVKSAGPPLHVKVCLINGAVFAADLAPTGGFTRHRLSLGDRPGLAVPA
jgi:hypothetical protein